MDKIIYQARQKPTVSLVGGYIKQKIKHSPLRTY